MRQDGHSKAPSTWDYQELKSVNTKASGHQGVMRLGCQVGSKCHCKERLCLCWHKLLTRRWGGSQHAKPSRALATHQGSPRSASWNIHVLVPPVSWSHGSLFFLFGFSVQSLSPLTLIRGNEFRIALFLPTPIFVLLVLH